MRIDHALAAAGVLAAGVAGCGGSSSPAPGANTTRPNRAATAPSSSSQSQGVNPNAPETNPAGDIPDNQVYVRFSVPGAPLMLKVPEGWSQSSHAGAVTFTDKLNSITIRTAHAATAPTAAHVRPVGGGRVTTVRRASGQAVRLTYTAKSPPDPVTGKSHTDAVERYLFFRNGTELILTLSGPKGADNVDPWRLVTNSVTWR